MLKLVFWVLVSSLEKDSKLTYKQDRQHGKAQDLFGEGKEMHRNVRLCLRERESER